MTKQQFEPDSWLHAGDDYASVSADFRRVAQGVLAETTALDSLGAGEAHPVDAAVGAILTEIGTEGQDLIGEIGAALDGHAERLRDTAEAYRAIEVENLRLAKELI